MRKVLRYLKLAVFGLGSFSLVIALFLALVYFLGPVEDAELTAEFDESQLEAGVDAYLAAREAAFDDITPGVEKQVIWAGAPEAETEWAVLYIHGFSASAQEIRPVPDRVAEALGANLVFTRLQGHGRTGEALAEATVAGWMADLAEALAVARKVGEKVLVISTSTGGTLAAAAALDKQLSKDVAALAFVSPNFGINNSAASLLTLPAARYWLPPLVGRERSFEPANEGQATYWTTTYPSVAVLPMAALVKEVVALDFSATKIPALFWYSEEDQVVVPEATKAVAKAWGGPHYVVHPLMKEGDDPFAHVVAGDIMSPNQTQLAIDGIVYFVEGL